MSEILIHRHLKYEIDTDTKEANLLGLDDTLRESVEPEQEEDPVLQRLMERIQPDLLDLVVPKRFTRNHISYTVVGVRANAFSHLLCLRSVTLPASIEDIGSFAFTGCPNLVSIVIDKKNRAYSSQGNCILEKKSKTLLVGIASTLIPEGTEVIGEDAFLGQIYLNSISLPSSVKKLSRGCFSYCQGFLGFSTTPIKPRSWIPSTPMKYELVLPQEIREIPEDAFKGCLSITHLWIPKTVTYLDPTAFTYCSSLVSIEVEEGNPVFEVRENCLVEKEDQVLVMGCKESKIPDNIIMIGPSAFASVVSFRNRLVFPATLKSICSYAFSGCENITNVTLKEGVEEIDDHAFDGCKGIVRVNLPEGLKRIGECAFGGCISLERVSFPSTVECIDDYAFHDNLSLRSVSLPKSLKSLGKGAFFHSGLLSVVIPGTLHHIPEDAFSNCFNLDDITLNEGVEEIGRGAFEDCPLLTSLVFPDSLKRVFLYAFKGCDKITSLHIGKNLEKIYADFFEDIDLREIDIDKDNPYYFSNGKRVERKKKATAKVIKDHFSYVQSGSNTMTLVGKGSGEEDGEYEIVGEDEEEDDDDDCGCEDEEREEEGMVDSFFCRPYSITVPERISFHGKEFLVTLIEDDIFYQDEYLERVSLPSTLLSIGSNNFFFCPNLKSIHIDEKNPYYSSAGNVLVDNKTDTLLIGLSESVIPEGVVNIAEKAFWQREGLKKIKVPSSVREISKGAFMDCIGLEEADLSQTSIPVLSGVFSGCSSLRKVILPEGLKAIGPFTFSDCISLKELSIPASVKEISPSAFNRCKELTDVIIANGNPNYEVKNHCLIRKRGTTLLHGFLGSGIPDGIKKIEQEAFCGDETLKSIDIPSTVTEISDDAFHACIHLSKVIFHEGLLHIGKEAFYECPLEELVLPEGLLSIGSSSFASNPMLKKIVFPSTLVSLSGFGFKDYRNLMEVSLPDSMEKLEEGIFAECRNLRKVRLPSALTSLPKNAFYQDSSLKSLSLPDTIERIGMNAFAESGLVSVSLPKSLTFVPVSLFEGCKNLKEVIFPEGIDKIEAYAFANTGIERISLPIGIRRVSTGLFHGCQMLKEVLLPEGIKIISEDAFSQSSIESIILPDSLIEIAASAFSDCPSLTTIHIGKNLKRIDEKAFDGTTNIKEVDINPGNKAVFFDGKTLRVREQKKD